MNDPNILKAQIEAFQLLALDQSFKFLGNLQTEVVRSDNKLAKGFQAASRFFANPSVQGLTTFSSEKQLKNFERDIFFEQSSQNLKVIANSPLFSDLVSLRIAEMGTLEGDERNDALRNLGRLLGVADYADRPPSVPPLSKKESDLVQSGKFQQLGIILIRQFESVEDKDDFISKLPIGNWPDDAKQKLLKNFIPEEPDTSKQIQSYLKEWTVLLKVGFTDFDFNQPLKGIVYLRQAPIEVQQAFRTTYQTFIDKENPSKKGMLQEKLDQIFSPPKPAPKEVKVEKKSAKVLSDDEVALKGVNVRLQFQIDRIKDLTGDEKETALKMGMSLFSEVRVLTDRITNSEIAELREGANRIEEDARRLQAHDLIDKMAKKVKDADLFAFALQFHHLEEGKALEFLSTLSMDEWTFGMKMRFLGNVVPSTQMGREAYLNRWTSIINRGFEKRSDDPLEQKIQSTALLNELKKGLEIDFQSVPQEVKKRFASALKKAGWSDLPFKL